MSYQMKQYKQTQSPRRAVLRKACVEFLQGLILAFVFFGFALIAGLLSC